MMDAEQHDYDDGVVNFVSPDTPIDLTNCDREPIHIPGAVQPHGAMIVVDDDQRVVMSSASLATHVGVTAEAAAGRPLAEVIGVDAAAQIGRMEISASGRHFDLVETDLGATGVRRFDATVHRSAGLTVIELEPEVDSGAHLLEQITTTMRSTIDRLERAESIDDLANGVADEMRRITGFDRVWVYRFHPDWHGEIIGESRRGDIETWLGMHYPASDIPVQARALFLRNWLRAIPDISFTPSPLVPALNPLTGEPLDIGNSVLRSVSPIHVQYLRNMGVTASLVISLVHRGRLWGLISGHHYSGPRRVPYSTRVMCEFLAQALSLQVGVTDRLAARDRALSVRAVLNELVSRVRRGSDYAHELMRDGSILQLAEADGAALVTADDTHLTGQTPATEDVRDIVAWLRRSRHEAFETSELSRELAGAAAYAGTVSGLMAVAIGRSRSDYLLWFRGERRQSVRWAGDPRKPVTVAEDGTERLHPRGSFELWEQEVKGTSAPWDSIVREASLELRRAVLDHLLEHTEEVQRLNTELQLTNAQLAEAAVELEIQAEELHGQRAAREQLFESEREAREDAELANRAKSDFLAVMSHELRTPLNAIGGYADLISMGVRGPVTEDQLSDLERIRVNQRHLLGLINSILNFSKLEAGAIPFNPSDVHVASVLAAMDAIVAPQMAAKSLTFTVGACDDALVARADEEKLRQILINLLTNALKFTAEGGRVDIACQATADLRFIEIAVTDTGAGISAQALKTIFEPFVQVDRHLVPTSEQGVGLGLAISRELARNMGGELTAESTPGVGSTFTVTLPAA